MNLLDKVYELLQVDKLDEEKQNEVKEKVNEIVEMKSKELAKEISENAVEEIKEELIEDYEKKYEEYKEDVISKFSNFVDDILEQEMQIPEKVLEYARKGELYEPLIEQFKVKLGIDEGAVQDDVKDLLREARDEIKKLKSVTNEDRKKIMELQEDAQEMATYIYLLKKCDGLSEGVKKKVVSLLEDVKSKEEIDRKFDLIVDSVSSSKESLNEVMMYCEDCGTEVEIDEEEKESKTCPECGGDLKVKTEGKGKEEVDEDEKRKLEEKEKKNERPSIQDQ